MVAVRLGDDQPRIAGEAHAAVAQDDRRVMAHILAVDDVLAVLVDERGLEHLVDVRTVDAHRAAALHLAHEAVGDAGKGEHLFFGDAQHVVVKACAVDDAPGRVGQIRRIVHDDGRVAGSGRDDLLAGLHGHAHHGLAAGDAQQRDVRMGHDRLAGFQRGLLDRGDQRRRAARRHDGLHHQAHGLLRGVLGRRMGVKDHGVARGDHADGIVDDGGGGVGRRGDRTDDPEGRLLDEHHALVAGFAAGLQVLNARRAAADQQVLLNLVLHVAVARFLVRQTRQVLGVVNARLAHGRDQLAALFQRHIGQLGLGGLGVLNRFLGGIAQPAAAFGRLRLGRGRRRGGLGPDGAGETAHNLVRNLPDLLFRQCHVRSLTNARPIGPAVVISRVPARRPSPRPRRGPGGSGWRRAHSG